LGDNFYTAFGYFAFWVTKYIFIPIGVGVAITIITHRLLQPQPDRQKKDGLNSRLLCNNTILLT